MTPTVGARVWLRRLRGVSSPSLRAQLGKVGTVLEVSPGGLMMDLLVAFETPVGVADRFWLKAGEVELVSEEVGA